MIKSKRLETYLVTDYGPVDTVGDKLIHSIIPRRRSTMLIKPKEYGYEVNVTLRGDVPLEMVNKITKNGEVPDMSRVCAEAVLYCFDRERPENKKRRRYRVEVVAESEESNTSDDEVCEVYRFL